jgi:hypothetical protein
MPKFLCTVVQRKHFQITLYTETANDAIELIESHDFDPKQLQTLELQGQDSFMCIGAEKMEEHDNNNIPIG